MHIKPGSGLVLARYSVDQDIQEAMSSKKHLMSPDYRVQIHLAILHTFYKLHVQPGCLQEISSRLEKKY